MVFLLQGYGKMDKNYILLDFGNVLYEIDFARTVRSLKQLCKDDVTIDFSNERQLDIFIDLEIGKLTSSEFYELFSAKYCKQGVTVDEITNAWNALFIAPFSDTNDVINTLKSKGYTIAIVSNTNEIHVEYFEPRSQSFLSKVDFIFYSHLMQRRKPNEDYFSYVLTTLNILPQQAVYIDDSSQHLATAKSLGITSYKKELHTTLSELLHSVNIL